MESVHHLRRRAAWQLAIAWLVALGWIHSAPAQSPDGFNPSLNGRVYALAEQLDGRILIGGDFTTVNGQTRQRIARLNADGSLDEGFTADANGSVKTLTVQRDGRILAGGSFTTLNGQARTNLARLHSSGVVDASFTAGTNPNPGIGTEVKAILLQLDEKILVAGEFGALNNYWCDRLGRLNTNGALDVTFHTGGFIDGGSLHALALQTDGKVVAAGDFTTFLGQWKYGIGRMTDVGIDTSFNPGSIYSTQFAAYCLAMQADGKILVGGHFTNLAGSASSYLARLGTTGAVDSSLGGGANGRVNSVVVQADGQIIVAGQFTQINGETRNRIARLNQNGTVDLGFNPDADGVVDSLAILADGKILVGGSFTSIGGQPRSFLARLNNDHPATQSFSYNGSALTWQRGGSSPEVWRTQFEYTTNGTDWVNLGNGARIAGGWQLTSLALPSNAVIRAWAPAAGGAGGGSARYLQASIGSPLCALQPVSRTNNLGTVATFTSLAVGADPMSYQWFKDDAPLSDGGSIAGALTPMLTITNCQMSDEGDYQVTFTNPSGSLTSVVATLTVLDPGLASQPVSLNRELGETAVLSVTAEGTLPFAYQWWKDGAPLPQTSASTLTLTNLQAADAGRYHVVVGNVSGSVTSAVAVLTVNAATVDDDFSISNSPGVVTPIAVQADGKILVGGSLPSSGSLHRRHPDGSVDNTFSPNVSSGVSSITVQPDGKIVVAGTFSSAGGFTRRGIARVNPTGTFPLDSAFDANLGGSSPSVTAVAVQADGKLVIGGLFTSVAGQPRTNLARLHPDGALDTDFNPGAVTYVFALAVQPDGKILVGGLFTSLDGQPRSNLARLQPGGAVDPNFDPEITGASAGAPYVSALALQADGRILAGGVFTSVAGVARTNIARLNPNGTLDSEFNPGADHNNDWQAREVRSLVVQADGKILVGGDFSFLGGENRNSVGRLHADGTLDLTFNPGGNGIIDYVNSLMLQADGKILVGGLFKALSGQPRTNLARLNNNDPATQQLAYQGSTITWLRGGASPEIGLARFAHTSDGAIWTELGDGVRVPGGWQMTNVSQPSGGTLRARGLVVGGYRNASSGWVETLLGAPVFVSQPASRTNNFGTTASFTVIADGPAPLNFQWLKDGNPLLDGSGVSGVTTSSLTLSNVSKFAEGDYRVVITNDSGSITSAVATLTVIDPVLTSQSIGGYREVGQNATFTVNAAGTGLSYQWFQNGITMPQATHPLLVLTNIQLSDAGTYRAIVTGTFGSVTSILGTLTVNAAGLDTNFNANVTGWVSPVVVQTDGRIIFGGGFTSVGGQSRGRVARVSTNGVLDTTFINPNANDDVYSLALQPDGKLLVGGEFTSLGGQTRYALGRLNTNGTLDTTFSTTVFNPEPLPPYTSYRVQAILLQPDGKVIVGTRSSRTLQNGMTITAGGVLRLNTNGTSDNTFSTGTIGAPIVSLAWQPDGKILVGGVFSSVGGQSRNRIARLGPNGAVDPNFNPGLAAPAGINPMPLAMIVQPDGRIIVGGAFTTIAGQSQTNLARLDENGILDDTFRPVLGGATYPDVQTVALQADGRILIGGFFNSLNGVPRSRLGRLNADGSLDHAFNPGANSDVYGLAVQPDGKVLVSGFFFQLGAQARSYIGRLHNSEPATQSLSYSNTTVFWSRGGTSPEVWRTSFETSTNGTNWILLGAGTRFEEQWRFSAPALPPGGFVRVRGFTVGGGYNAGSWFAESRLRITPGIVTKDGSFGLQSNHFTFNVNAPAGAATVIEASTNLVHWSPIFTNLVNDLGRFLFQDLNSGVYPRRFYRTRFHNGPLPQPSFQPGATEYQPGQFSFSLNGVGGQRVVIECSTNLVNWTPLDTNTFGLRPLLYVDSLATNFPLRFYRTRLP